MRPALPLLWVFCGCATRIAAGGPHAQTARAYANALRARDSASAWSLQSEEARGTTPLPEFRSLLEQNQAEVNERASELAEIVSHTMPPPRARARLPSGEHIELILEDGAWRIDSGIGDRPTLRTPEDTVLALRHALQRRSLGAMVRLLSRAERAELDAEIANLVDETGNPLRLQIETSADRSTVRTPGGRAIVLEREGNEWRIVDIR